MHLGYRRIYGWLLAICIAGCEEFALGQSQPILEIVPAAPRYQESVYARIRSVPFDFGVPFAIQVAMNGDTLSVTWQVLPEVGSYTMDVELGRFPAGTYKVNISHGSTTGTAQFTVGPAPVHPIPTTLPAVPNANYTDLWSTPSESGTAIAIVQGPTNLLFAVWCVYDINGAPTWYTLQPGEWQTAKYFTEPIYKTRGPYFGGTYDASMVHDTSVGTGTLFFSDYQSAFFSFDVEGIRGSKALTRISIE